MKHMASLLLEMMMTYTLTTSSQTTSWRQLQQPRRLNWSVRCGHRSIGYPDDWTGQVPIAADRCQVDNPTDAAID